MSEELPIIPHKVEFTKTQIPRRHNSADLAAAAGIIHELRAQLQTANDELATARQESHTDKDTGLPNRRAFEEDIQKLLDTTKTSGGSIAVMLGDLNGLKKANETYGYGEGDKLIRAARGTTRPEEDTLYRYGGDEFVFILPNFEPREGQTKEELIDKTLNRVETSYSASLQTANLQEGIEGSITVVLDMLEPGDTAGSIMQRLGDSLHVRKDEFYDSHGQSRADDRRLA